MHQNDNKKDQIKYCVITEQGDLGLGVNEINKKDQEKVNENIKKDNKKK